MKARVHVTLKPGVLDPQGQAIAQTLGRLGYREVSAARVGKMIELDLDGEISRETAQIRVKEMCDKLLANTVIESYRVEIDG